MNKPTLNHIVIYDMLNTYYLKYKAKFLLLTLITSLFEIIEVNRQKLTLLGGSQGTDDKGIAEDISVNKNALVMQILLNAGPACSKFHKLLNNKLSVLLKFTKSKLLKMRPETLVQKANTVVETCTENIADLDGTGVTVASIALLSSAIADYLPEVNDSKIAIRNKTIVTKQIKTIVKLNTNIINNELKGAMSTIMVTEEVIYNEFIKMLVLPHEGVRKHLGPRPAKVLVVATVLDDNTSLPIMGAVIKYAGVRGSIKTDINGEASKEISEGAHLGKITALGYTTQSFAFTLTELGYAVTVRMIPIGV